MPEIREILIENSRSILGFETTGSGTWKKWDRFLTIDGRKAYQIGNICGTCAFFFERMGGANQSIHVDKLVDTLNHGVTKLDERTIEDLKAIIPDGEYIVVLSEIQPRLCSPSSSEDYFSHEQIALWGVDGFWGLPHTPKTEYYRLQARQLREERGFFEFLIPTFPHSWLKQDRIDEYKEILARGDKPTLVSLGILDIKQPANWIGDQPITSHWCLAHYLLDGHHKAYAAAVSGKPITMISFIAVDQGISSADDIRWLLEAGVTG
jgi:hypothetical protein